VWRKSRSSRPCGEPLRPAAGDDRAECKKSAVQRILAVQSWGEFQKQPCRATPTRGLIFRISETRLPDKCGTHSCEVFKLSNRSVTGGGRFGNRARPPPATASSRCIRRQYAPRGLSPARSAPACPSW